MTENIPKEIPELPSGQRWNIVKVVDECYSPPRTFYHLRLESKKWLAWRWIDRLQLTALTPTNILDAANQISTRQEARAQRLKTEDKYLGAYPPKRLG